MPGAAAAAVAGLRGGLEVQRHRVGGRCRCDAERSASQEQRPAALATLLDCHAAEQPLGQLGVGAAVAFASGRQVGSQLKSRAGLTAVEWQMS